MGMFDDVRYKAECIKCKKLLVNWQSKDGECILDLIEPESVNHFYGYCSNCQSMNNVKVEKSNVRFIQSIKGFDEELQ